MPIHKRSITIISNAIKSVPKHMLMLWIISHRINEIAMSVCCVCLFGNFSIHLQKIRIDFTNLQICHIENTTQSIRLSQTKRQQNQCHTNYAKSKMEIKDERTKVKLFPFRAFLLIIIIHRLMSLICVLVSLFIHSSIRSLATCDAHSLDYHRIHQMDN